MTIDPPQQDEPIDRPLRYPIMRPVPRSVPVVTAVALLNCLAALLPTPHWALGLLFLGGPLLVIWLVWQVLTDDRAAVRDLDDQDQWGYQDRPDLRPVE